MTHAAGGTPEVALTYRRRSARVKPNSPPMKALRFVFPMIVRSSSRIPAAAIPRTRFVQAGFRLAREAHIVAEDSKP